jgi:hypothetical protein
MASGSVNLMQIKKMLSARRNYRNFPLESRKLPPVGIGWLLGGLDVDTKRVMALGTGQRNIAAALVVEPKFRGP